MIIVTILFAFLGTLLAATVLFQQSKGEIGFGGAPSQGTQIVFGGSGGQEFFERATWLMGAIFMASCLWMSYQTKDQSRSILESHHQVIRRSR